VEKYIGFSKTVKGGRETFLRKNQNGVILRPVLHIFMPLDIEIFRIVGMVYLIILSAVMEKIYLKMILSGVRTGYFKIFFSYLRNGLKKCHSSMSG
jgi:hypothetical protein